VVSALVLLVEGFVDAPRTDRAGICEPGRHHDCFQAFDGRVVSLGSDFSLRSDNAVTVSYDDGRAEATLRLRGHAHPPVRARPRRAV
jgi:hypothetical protein